VADCTPNATAQSGDIRYVGVTSTAPLAVSQGRPADALLAFWITTWAGWYNVGSNTIPFVDIDTNSDGLPDFEVRGTKLAGTDVLVAATVNLHAPADSPPVQVLQVNGQYGDVDSGVFNSTGPALFDAVRPGLWAQGAGDPALSYLARPGTALMVNRDATAAGA
jgi:hypothetical protein